MRLNYYHTKVFSFVMAAFAFISSFFQVLSLDPILKLAVFGGTLFCGIGAFVAYRQVKGHDAAVQSVEAVFRNRPKGLSTFEVHKLRNEGEVKAFWGLDQDSFGEASISYDHFLGWWRAFPNGIYALFDDGEMVGGIGVWPLRKKAFDEFMHGMRSEHEIVGRSIVATTTYASRPYWYIGGILVNGKYRKSNAVRVLLAEALVAWYEEVKNEACVSLVTLAYSRDGAAMLQRFGFNRYLEPESVKDRHPIYVLLDAKPSDLQRLFARVIGVISPDGKAAQGADLVR